jgi:hypothetical protein
MSTTPTGVIAVLIGPDGREVANAADFGCGGPAGFSQQETQTMRAKQRLAHATMKALASPLLSNAIDTYQAERLVDEMCRAGGCRVLTIPTGHDELPNNTDPRP